MAISLVTVQGDGTAYLNNEVDYLVSSDKNDYERTNRPLGNLAARDAALRDGVNAAITELNNAAGSVASLTTRLAVEHNADGTHIGGSPHGPVAIPLGHSYLSVLSAGGFQNLTAVVGGGAGTLCDHADARLRYGFVLVAAVDGDYTTPKAALDAGEDHILIAPGSYDDSAGGAVILADSVVILGIGKPQWTVHSFSLNVGAEGSAVENVEIVATYSSPLQLYGVDGFFGRNLKLVPATANNGGIEAINSSYGFLENIEIEGLLGGGSSIGGIYLSGTYSHWTIRHIICEQTTASNQQNAILVAGDVSDINIYDVRASYMHNAVSISFLTANLSNIRVEKVRCRNGHAGVLGGYGLAVNVSAGSYDVDNLIIRDVDADAGSVTVDAGVNVETGGKIYASTIENVKSYVGAYGYSVQLYGNTEVVDCSVRDVSVRGATTTGVTGVLIRGIYRRLFIEDVYMHAMVGIASATSAAVKLQGPTTLGAAEEFDNFSISNVSVFAEYASYGVYIEGNTSVSAQATITRLCIQNVNVKNATGINAICVYFRAAVADTKFENFSISGVNMSGGSGLIFVVNSTGTDTLKRGSITNCTGVTSADYIFSHSGNYTVGAVIIISGVAWDASIGLFNPGLGTTPFYQLTGSNKQVS